MGAPDGSLSASLGTKAKAREPQKEASGGIRPQPIPSQRAGAGGDADTGPVPNLTGQTCKWLPSGAGWWWEVRRGGGRGQGACGCDSGTGVALSGASASPPYRNRGE